MSKVKVTEIENENVKIVFCSHMFVKGESIYIKPRSKWSPAFLICRPIHFTSRNAYFCDICL